MAFDILSRRDKDREAHGDRVPPHQKLVEHWPVLTYAGTPHIELKDWRLRIFGEVENEIELTWDEFTTLPQTKIHCDIHCVTSWSRLDNDFEGVAFEEIARRVKPLPEARSVMAHCFGGYTTNVLMGDVMRENVLLARKHGGEDLSRPHGGPCRLVVPHLYFWKSAKWVRGLEFLTKDKPGFWEQYGYHMRGDPWKEERYS